MGNDSIQQSLKLFIVLSRAHRSMNDVVNKYIAKQGLNPTEFAVLELLYHKGEQPLQQIGGKILLASGSITYVVDKLEQKEFLERIACKNDRRVTFAKITEKGKTFIESIFPDHEKKIDDIMNVLTSEEKEMATELIKKIGYNALDQEQK
ncbi:MarR family transcriptional regulator [Peribacillus psychrosaccharolyticus]|uniref:MarR family transcriptional regulator n=1 Tax=Peribacillus psychrosaccharolyticus TaxID=1407 RepID=A0A974NPN8_PERPY|nr:MarR family transcriptional regulator [Peribacillus psychrosaccharolyticus]MEC2057557.1 MarR family transcriptional regulator [Peribacillus psychrosaccharolyticus]MED3746013.1 MarR family transcriptional regulator [Peribacillus psychrosaccharolyticus]QQT01730.1 MarR family transcriptional regulator [Peribacillus psychrosaccharolyticus]